jgi:predicted RNase H-like nuclease (RuvC/YqgF family)
LDSPTLNVVLAILGSSALTAFLTWIFTRRKIAAETRKTDADAASQEVDIQSKVSDFLEKMRGDNVDLNKRNVELEKENSELSQHIETLKTRLETRDKQLEACNKQFELLRQLAKDAPVTETLRTQLEVINQMVIKLQDAQSEGQKLMIEKEKTMQELLKTDRNLDLPKPRRDKQ